MGFNDDTIPNDGASEKKDFVDSESGFDSMGATFDGIQGGLGVVDRYVLKEKLGAGGFGSVYLAEDTEAKILVALKVLPSIMSDIPEEMEKVRDNFALVSKLNHPNIAGLKHLHKIRKIDSNASHALGVSTGGYLVVMEYVAGSTLSSWEKAQGGKIAFEQAVDICSKVAEALDYAHGHKIIHRDIKPSNIMVVFDQTGAVKDIKVLDFGLAAEIRSSMSRVSKEQGDTSGTRPYMAPEQWSGGKQGFATDQYSLAVMFYELVSGEVPFNSVFETGDSVLMMNIVRTEPVATVEVFNKKQNVALLKGLAKDPMGRFTSCGDFVTALGGVRVRKNLSHKGTKTQRKSGKSLGIVAAVCIVGLLSFGAHMSHTSYKSHKENQKQVQQQQKLDVEKQAKVNEFVSSIERALSTGDLSEVGSEIAELESLGGISEAAKLRARYESKADEREVIERSAVADVAHGKAQQLTPTEGFDKKLDELEVVWKKAENARAGEEWGMAVSSYDSVIENCKKLQKFNVERSEAKSAKTGCEIAKRDAEEADAYNDALEQWTVAESDCQKAVAAFSNGALNENGFVNAIELWNKASLKYGDAKRSAQNVQEYRKKKSKYETEYVKKASLLNKHGGKKWDEVLANAKIGERSGNDPTAGIKSYESAFNGLSGAVAEAKSLQVDKELKVRITAVEKILGQAESAKSSGNWQKVFDLLEDLDTSYAEVGSESSRLTKQKKALLEEANGHLTPSMKFTAYVDGREVAATLKNGSQSWSTPKTLDLKEDGDYAFSVEYVVGKKRYKCNDFSITSNWKGLKDKRLDLQEVKGPVENETWTAELGNGVKMELMPVVAGSFTMGSSVTEREECVKEGGKMEYYDDEKQHQVTLTKPFWIGKYEVTQRQYEQIMGNNPSDFKGSDNPVETVSWNNAMEFCRKLTDKEHASGRLPSDYKYTLPTEAQWEFASRGGKQSKGYKYSGSDDFESVGVRGRIKPVGQKKPNELGLYDMSGNVAEWCLDHDVNDSGMGTVIDPLKCSGSKENFYSSGINRELRGGHYGNYTYVCASGWSWNEKPNNAQCDIGFRVCLVPDRDSGAAVNTSKQKTSVSSTITESTNRKISVDKSNAEIKKNSPPAASTEKVKPIFDVEEAGIWTTYSQAALDKANAENKNILLDFTGSDWCGWCVRLDKEVFEQPEFIDYAKESLICIKVDFPRRKQIDPEQAKVNKELSKKMGVRGYPTILILNPDGKVVGKTGYKRGGAVPYVDHIKEMINPKEDESSSSVETVSGNNDSAKDKSVSKTKISKDGEKKIAVLRKYQGDKSSQIYNQKLINQLRCINNLRMIDGAKQQTAVEMGWTDEIDCDLPENRKHVNTYIKSGAPECLSGGTYVYGKLSDKPKCSIKGHLLDAKLIQRPRAATRHNYMTNGDQIMEDAFINDLKKLGYDVQILTTSEDAKKSKVPVGGFQIYHGCPTSGGVYFIVDGKRIGNISCGDWNPDCGTLYEQDWPGTAKFTDKLKKLLNDLEKSNWKPNEK